MNDDELLKYLYYDLKLFSGSKDLYEKAKERHPKITMKIVKEWLSKQQTSQMNDKPIIKKDYKPIYSESPYAFQIDLTFFPRYKKTNNGYWVLFTAININTRFGYVFYGKDKEMTTVINFMKQLEEQTIINVIEGDLGSEFNNYIFKEFCQEHNITLDLFKSDSHKLGIINRWHRTIKEKLSKYFDSYDTTKWIDIIDKIVYNYNHSVNRGIGFKPVDVNDFKENLIRETKKAQGNKITYDDFKIDDYVRILNEKTSFDDKLKSKYSNELFQITKVKNNSVIMKAATTGALFQARKNELKIVTKPDNNIILSAKVKAKGESKKERVIKKDGLNEDDIRTSKRERKPNSKYI